MYRTKYAFLFMLAIVSFAAGAPSSGWAQVGPVNLTNNPPGNQISSVAWSPDGTKIAFHFAGFTGFGRPYTGDPRHGIYMMNADGTNPVQLTQSDRREGSPSWSPDGTKIVFSSFHISSPNYFDYSISTSFRMDTRPPTRRRSIPSSWGNGPTGNPPTPWNGCPRGDSARPSQESRTPGVIRTRGRGRMPARPCSIMTSA